MKRPTDYNRRLKGLEDNMQDTPIGDTQIAWSCLSSREQMLFDKVDSIIKEYGMNPPSDILPEIMPYVTKAAEIMWKRISKLWSDWMNGFILLGDTFSQALFWVRFNVWIRETMFLITRNRFEEEDLKKRFGDEWPPREDPRWSEHEKAVEEWEDNYKKGWSKEDRELIEACLETEQNVMLNRVRGAKPNVKRLSKFL